MPQNALDAAWGTALGTALNDEKRQRLLEEYVRARSQAAPSRSAIRRRSPGAIAPLTLAQEELWRRETENRKIGRLEIAPLYNECVAVRMRGPLDDVALEKSLNEIVRRHEIWRTTFETRAGKPVQVVHPAAPLRLRKIDGGDFPASGNGCSAGDGGAPFQAAVADDVRRKFALASEPPIRATLVRIGARAGRTRSDAPADDDERWLFVAAHLMVLDGISAYQLFPAELATLYRAYAAGKASPLAELPIQYGDFAVWQREAGEEERRAAFADQIGYWRTHLHARPLRPDWPTGKPPTERRSYRGMTRPFAFSAELSARVREFARKENSSVFLVLLAAFGALLHRQTKQPKIVLGTPVSSGRNHNEVLNLLGYFLNAVTLVLNFEADPTFHELVAQTRIVLSDAMLHADVPIEQLAREIGQEQNPTPSPFFRAVVGMQPPMANLDLDWEVTTMDVDSGGSPWEFYLAFIDRQQAGPQQIGPRQIGPQPIVGRMQFDPESIGADEAMATLAKFQRVLEYLIGNPLQRVSEIRLS